MTDKDARRDDLKQAIEELRAEEEEAASAAFAKESEYEEEFGEAWNA
jgi:phage regulator Rha-like protein